MGKWKTFLDNFHLSGVQKPTHCWVLQTGLGWGLLLVHYLVSCSLDISKCCQTSSTVSSLPARVSIAAVTVYSWVSICVRIVIRPIEWHFSGVLVVVTWSTKMLPSFIAVSMDTASPVFGLMYFPKLWLMMPCDTACVQTNTREGESLFRLAFEGHSNLVTLT